MSEENKIEDTGKDRVSFYRKPPIEHRFSSTNQPDPAKQSATKQKRKFTRETMKGLLNMRYALKDESEIKRQLIAAYGEEAVKRMTAMEIATIVQIHKAIKLGDTRAFNAIMVNTFGQPKQITELSGLNGGPIQSAQTITQVIINNPHKKVPASKE